MGFLKNILALSIVLSAGVAVSSREIHQRAGDAENYFPLGSCYDHLTPDHFNSTNRNGIIPEDFRWPYGRIPYIFKDNLDEAGIEFAKQGIAMVEAATCLKFVPRDGEVNYLVIKNDEKGCWCGGVGMRGGAQSVNLENDSCYSATTAAHELLHGAGLWHEHARPDRDQYITVFDKNLKPAKKYNYDRCDQGHTIVQDGCSTFGEPYNVHSIMHYPGYVGDTTMVFDVNKPVMQSKPGVDKIPNGLETITQQDTNKINKMYRNCAK